MTVASYHITGKLYQIDIRDVRFRKTIVKRGQVVRMERKKET